MADTSRIPLLSAEGLKKYYTAKSGIFSRSTGVARAVDGVSFQLSEEETLGLVGKSGYGKSTLGRQLVRLEHPAEGRVVYNDHGLGHMSQAQMKPFHTQLQMIFQDSYSSLNPRKHVSEILAEPILYHGSAKRGDIYSHVEGLLDMVGPPRNYLRRYPHEFSDGQRQRIDIAKALSLNLRLLVCDKPVNVLDVSIQVQILNLLRDLQKELGLTCIFIGHGLGAVNYVSDRIAVMYLGKMVEITDRKELFDHPLHSYSRALFEAVPIADPRKRRKHSEGIVGGEIASNVSTPSGCPFHPGCPHCKGKCMSREMELKPAVPGNSHLIAYIRFKGLEREDRGVWQDIYRSVF